MYVFVYACMYGTHDVCMRVCVCVYVTVCTVCMYEYVCDVCYGMSCMHVLYVCMCYCMYVYMYVMYVVCYIVICTYYCVTRNTRCFRHQISIVIDEIMNPLKVSAPLHSTKKLMQSHTRVDIARMIDRLAAKAFPAMRPLPRHVACTSVTYCKY